MNTYSPPARGINTQSSPYVRAPASDSTPATTHTVTTRLGVPTLHVITRAFRNTPVPMTTPVTIDMAANRPSPRTSVLSLAGVTVATARQHSRSRHRDIREPQGAPAG